MRNILSAMMIFACLPLPALARNLESMDGGNSVGNGGYSVACWSMGELQSIESLDLYEGRLKYGYNYQANPLNNNDDPEETAALYARQVDKAIGVRLRAVFDVERMVHYVAKKMEFLPSTQPLKQSHDARFKLRDTNCHLVQTINFNKDIEANIEYWQRLSAMDKAALYLHEAVYWYLRNAGRESDSRRVRKLVSYLFAGGQLTSRNEPLPDEVSAYQQCSSIQRGAFQVKTRFTAYVDQDGYLNVLFRRLGDFAAITEIRVKSTVRYPIGSTPISGESAGRVSGVLESPLADSGFAVNLSWGQGKITVQGSLEDEYPFRDDIQCRTVTR